MNWLYNRPDCWEPLRGSLVPTVKDEEGYPEKPGYAHVRDSVKDRGFGSWSLYAREVGADTRLPSYILYVEDGTGRCAEVWIPTFPDLLVWMSRYGRLGEEMNRG